MPWKNKPYVGRDQAKNMFYGVEINANFTLNSRGDTLRNRGVEWALYHFPDGHNGDEVSGFPGESHLANTYTSYRDANKDARAGYCDECDFEANPDRA